MSKIALLILDAQVNMFADPTPVHQAPLLLHILQQLLEQAHARQHLVVFVQNTGGPGDPDELNTPGWHIHPALTLHDTDLVIHKYQSDAFANTGLHELLRQHGVTHLVVAGMQTELCVNATCRQAQELGYTVTLVADAHSTFDDAVPALEIIEQYNADLQTVAAVQRSREVMG
jgi:nicotinamidase-related amidase